MLNAGLLDQWTDTDADIGRSRQTHRRIWAEGQREIVAETLGSCCFRQFVKYHTHSIEVCCIVFYCISSKQIYFPLEKI